MNITASKKRKYLPKCTNEFTEVITNTTARMKCGEGYTEKFIATFIDEIRRTAISQGRLIIPNFIDIRLEVKAAKQNNIKMKEGMTDAQKALIPIVPRHYVAKIKPHVGFKAIILTKKAI